MNKIPIQETMSLGTFCFSAHLLRKYCLRPCSYPFDWVFCQPKIVADCFSDKFSLFLDKKCYKEHYDPGKCHHSTYDPTQPLYEHYNPPFFFHHNPTREPHYQHFVRSVNRVNQLLKRKTSKLFLIIYSRRSTIIPSTEKDQTGLTGDEIVSQLYHLKKTIDDLTQNGFLLVINCLEKPPGHQSSLHSLHRLYNNIIIMNFYTSAITGTEFDDPTDWDLVKKNIDEIYTFKLLANPIYQSEHDPF